MKTAILLEEHFDYFAELDPFELLDRALSPDRVCLGTVIEGKDGGYDIPAALMILRMTEEKAIVEWIFVRPELRMHGIGSDLMAHAFKVALAAGYDKLYLSREKSPDWKDICQYEDSFLEEYSFENEEELTGEQTEFIDTEPIKMSMVSASVDDYYDALEAFEPVEGLYDVSCVLTKSD